MITVVRRIGDRHTRGRGVWSDQGQLGRRASEGGQTLPRQRKRPTHRRVGRKLCSAGDAAPRIALRLKDGAALQRKWILTDSRDGCARRFVFGWGCKQRSARLSGGDRPFLGAPAKGPWMWLHKSDLTTPSRPCTQKVPQDSCRCVVGDGQTIVDANFAHRGCGALQKCLHFLGVGAA